MNALGNSTLSLYFVIPLCVIYDAGCYAIGMATLHYVLEIWKNAHFGPIGPGKAIQPTHMKYCVHTLWMKQGNVLPIVSL